MLAAVLGRAAKSLASAKAPFSNLAQNASGDL
jgi:hypothetical protein